MHAASAFFAIQINVTQASLLLFLSQYKTIGSGFVLVKEKGIVTFASHLPPASIRTCVRIFIIPSGHTIFKCIILHPVPQQTRCFSIHAEKALQMKF